MAKRSSLGKGLDALFLDNTIEDAVVTTLKITEIEPNTNQPRSDFDEEALRELADSIREHGVIQPLVVRPFQGAYQIVAGERRWRASRIAGLSEVPVVIRELDDHQTLEIAIVENLQREDLNPIELAQGYKNLMDQYDMTQEQVAEKLGKSRPVIANTIRMLSLPPNVLEYVRDGKISKGHAKALLSLEDDALIEETAERIVHGEMLVRDIEKLAREKKQIKPEKVLLSPATSWGNSYYKEMELALAAELGRKVHIVKQGKKIVMELEFYHEEELAELADQLTQFRHAVDTI